MNAHALVELTCAMRRYPYTLGLALGVPQALFALLHSAGDRARVAAVAAGAPAAIATAEAAFSAAGVPPERRCARTNAAMQWLRDLLPAQAEPEASSLDQSSCAKCGAPDGRERGLKPLKMCAACRGARYCSASRHQQAHWPEHKAACKAARAAAPRA